MADTVATVLTRIDERLEKCDQIPVIANPANPELTFSTHWEDNQYSNFRRLMGVYASTARQARDETDKAESIAAWQKLFGESFGKGGGSGSSSGGSSAGSGGNRTGQGSRPSAPAVAPAASIPVARRQNEARGFG